MPARMSVFQPIAIPSGNTYSARCCGSALDTASRSNADAASGAPASHAARPARKSRRARSDCTAVRRAALSNAAIAPVAAPRAIARGARRFERGRRDGVGPVGRGSQVPGGTILVAGGGERVREHPVRAAALRGLDAVEHSRAQQGVRELHHAGRG